ncbi:hypothetical protein DL546_009045 [Coniochaeta pulveracea]|uniref:Uncharacterized protein n=1 Tax=Coniochaeta pulveracea TaxID=177199 RepID=A0A420YJ56_9PEZI|nr:hypothetical protein DL546_009045 [Coniochaeta pulveracea]
MTWDTCHANHCAINAERVRLQKDTASDVLEHYDAIFLHLASLLRATSMQARDTAAPKSLVAMCLRKVPDFIREEQFWNQKEHEENGTKASFEDADVAAQVYWDLESTYGISERGWKQLAIVVQSHGIKMVKEAIEEGLIAKPWALLLARLGNQAKGFADRTQLLEAVLFYCRAEGRLGAQRVDKEPDLSAQSIQYVHPDWANNEMAVSIVGKLLVQQPPSHKYIMSTGFGELWSSAITDLTSHCPSYGTTSFLIESLQILGGLSALGRAFSTPHPLAKAKQSYFEALSVLTTMSIMGRNTLATDISPYRHDRITNICKRVEYVLRSSIARMGKSPTIGVHRNTYFIQLAMFFAKDLTAELTEDDDMLLANFWSVFKLRPEINDHLYGGAVALIPTIARTCCRRQTAEQPRDLLSKLFDRLEDASPDGAPLLKMRTEAAFYLAELTGDPRDLNHAERLAQTACEDIGRTLHTPARSRTFAGFRWDEGISEWVTATPLVAHRKNARRISAAGGTEESTPRTPPVSNAFPEPITSTPDVSTPERTITAVNKRSPGEQKPARRSSRILSVLELDISSDESGELDELSLSLDREETEKENRAPVAKHESTKIGRAMKRKQSRRSLLNTQLLSQVSAEDDHASSDDELSIM